MAPYHGEFEHQPAPPELPVVKVNSDGAYVLLWVAMFCIVFYGTRWGNEQMCKSHVAPTWIDCAAFQPRHAEVDHLTELELGGSGKNLWPQVRN